MSTGSSACDHAVIERFLEGELDQRGEVAIQAHLDHCPNCRRRMDEMAAVGIELEDASCFLRNDELDSELHVDSHVVSGETREVPGAVADAGIAAVLERLSPSDDPRMLGRFGGYEVVGVIGCGGMGVVLKGFDSPLNRYVAIKVLAPHLASSGAARKRFSREGQAAASVIHPNVVAIYQVSEANGFPYLVMPYLGAESLEKRIAKTGPMSSTAVLRIALQVARGLAAAHAQGLVHRDIKPANILLNPDVERVVITDFGLARTVDDASLTKTGVLAGTPQYMSPEQACGSGIDQRSDLFSLGSVMYAMCTGRPPFRAETSYGILRRITDEQPRPIREINPDVPVWLEKVIRKLHAKEADERYRSARDVAELLEACLAHVQEPTRVPLPDSLAARDRPLTSLLLGGAALLLGISLLAWRSDRPEKIAADPGETSAAVNTPDTASVADAVQSDGPGEAPGSTPADSELEELESVFEEVRDLRERFDRVEGVLDSDEQNGP